MVYMAILWLQGLQALRL